MLALPREWMSTGSSNRVVYYFKKDATTGISFSLYTTKYAQCTYFKHRCSHFHFNVKIQCIFCSDWNVPFHGKCCECSKPPTPFFPTFKMKACMYAWFNCLMFYPSERRSTFYFVPPHLNEKCSRSCWYTAKLRCNFAPSRLRSLETVRSCWKWTSLQLPTRGR